MGKFNIDYIKYIISALVLAFVSYVIYKVWGKVSDMLGITKEESQQVQEQQQQDNIDSNIQKFSTVQKSTKTDAEWKSIADLLYADLTAGFTKTDDAAYQVSRPKNDVDFWKLFAAFGKRQDYNFGFQSGDAYDLQYFIRLKIPSKIAAINQNYLSKKITFKF